MCYLNSLILASGIHEQPDIWMVVMFGLYWYLSFWICQLQGKLVGLQVQQQPFSVHAAT